ncbi:hypothetical protein, partial [Brachybacterium phenoliresistens]
ALNDAAFALGTFVGAGALSESEARALLQDVARGWGRDWVRCAKTIENGLKAGMAQPRSIPESTVVTQDNTRLVDITRMIANGLAKGRVETMQNNALPAAIDAANDSSEPESVDLEAENDNEPQGAIVATAFKWIDPKTLPRREFAYGKHLIRKYVSVTVSPGGLGKTS